MYFLIDALALCDTIRITQLIAAASDSRGLIPSQVYFANGICGTKPLGLAMNLNIGALAAQLGYPLGAAFQVPMQGTFEGPDPDGNPVILWSINSEIGQTVEGTVIDSVQGTIRTTLTSLTPAQESSSCGQNRTYLVNLRSDGTPTDFLTINVHQTILSHDYHDTLTIENIALAAKAGLPLNVGVRIQTPPDSVCGPVHSVEGLDMTLTASPISPQPIPIDSYSWTVTGATVLGAQDAWEVTVHLPSPPQLVTIAVAVETVGIVATNQIQFTPLSSKRAGELNAILKLVCRIRTELRLNEFFNPLSDPIRESIRQVSPANLKAIGASARNIGLVAERIVSMVDSIQDENT